MEPASNRIQAGNTFCAASVSGAAVEYATHIITGTSTLRVIVLLYLLLHCVCFYVLGRRQQQLKQQR